MTHPPNRIFGECLGRANLLATSIAKTLNDLTPSYLLIGENPSKCDLEWNEQAKVIPHILRLPFKGSFIFQKQFRYEADYWPIEDRP